MTKKHKDVGGAKLKEVCTTDSRGETRCKKQQVRTHQVVCSYITPYNEIIRGMVLNEYIPGVTKADEYQVCPGVEGFDRIRTGALPSVPGSGTMTKVPRWKPVTSDDFHGTFKEEKKDS